MKSSEELRSQLRSIDHRGYPAYKSLAGSYQFPGFSLIIDHVQETLSRRLRRSMWKLRTVWQGFRRNFMQRTVPASLCRISSRGGLPLCLRILISRRRARGRAAFCPLQDVGRRCWNGVPARSRRKRSSPGFMWDSRLSEERSMQGSWRRFCLIFCPAA